MKYRLAFAAVLGLYLLAGFALPQAELAARELYLMPPFVVALVLLAWKSELL